MPSGPLRVAAKLQYTERDNPLAMKSRYGKHAISRQSRFNGLKLPLLCTSKQQSKRR